LQEKGHNNQKQLIPIQDYSLYESEMGDEHRITL